ncbi:peroxiredoxin [Pontibacter ummariensis]|uniref:Peroxiredoxin n=1 Tax=Pontibacter ummariensis TaxID=1610492 RepID=A0A239JWB7_9BACT|nr:TlpA disulfide reductase family protein [Pontibacter ummariensis]PRY07306.1 peroxiredoxin [Pontibacter ummariensis]SNT10009.1 Peroxiredoxin [Pontibacter ummariensis]
MKKGIFIFVAAVVVLAVVFYIDSRNSSDEKLVAPAGTENVQGELPLLPLTRLDSTRIIASDLEGKVVLVFFQPDCDPCKREAEQIRARLHAFDGYTLYFVSDAPLPELKRFALESNLAKQQNVFFAQASLEDITNTVGSVKTPSVFIFSEEGNLVKSFIGEAPIEEVVQHL